MRADANNPANIVQALGELRLWSSRFITNLVFTLSHHQAFEGVPTQTIQRGADVLMDELMGVIARRGGSSASYHRTRHSVSLTRRQWMEIAMRMLDASEHFLSAEVHALISPILHRLTIALAQLPPSGHRRGRAPAKSFAPRSSSSTTSRPTPAGPG